MYIVDLMPIYVIETFLTQGYRKSRSQKISPLQVPRPWTESLAINRGLWQERVKGKRTDYKQQKNQASNKDFMASFFQADAGERGLPALTSEIEEGSNLFSPPPHALSSWILAKNISINMVFAENANGQNSPE